MYSRFPKHSDRPIQLPEHYSGCAFSEAEASRSAPTAPPMPPPIPDPPPDRHENHSQPCMKGEIASVFGRSLNLFSKGLQFEELLLIGLIILLARTEQESDMILWLALLLFCK